MEWQQKFEELFFPYLEKYSKTSDKFKKEELENFFKKILREDYDLDSLFLIYLLLDDEVREFFQIHLRKLINSINIQSKNYKKVNKGFIRGKLLVKPTIIDFRIRRFQPNRFNCKEIERSYDSPENELLKYLLVNIHELYRKLPSQLKITTEDDYEKEESKYKGTIVRKVSEIIKVLLKYLNNVKIKSIKVPKRPNTNMIKAARNNRNPLYRKVHMLYEKYYALFLNPKFDKNLIENVLDFKNIIPISEEKQFEIFILILIMNQLDLSDKFSLKEIGLITYKRDYSVCYEFDVDHIIYKIYLYYNKIPNYIAKNAIEKSKYKQIANQYNIKTAIKRPDIIFEIRRNKSNEVSYLFLEVKCTKKESYVRKSVYKCFGYLYDFNEFLNSLKKPHMILVIDEIKNLKKDILPNKGFLLIINWKQLFNKLDYFPKIIKLIS